MQHGVTLKSTDIHFYFKMMIWMCSQFGPPIKQKVPKVINPDLPIHLRCWDENNPKPVFQWAGEEAYFLASKCGVAQWPIQVMPSREKAHQQAEENMSAQRLDSNAWIAGVTTAYFIDQYGRPVFYYDPSRCVETGYLTHLLVPRFARLKLYARRPPQSLTHDEVKSLTRLLICHMGLGFTLLACTQAQSKANWSPLAILNPQQGEEVEMQYLFGTIMTLCAHKLTAEQILASYGSLMSSSTRRLIRAMLWQAEAQTDAMNLLRRLSSPSNARTRTTRSASPARNHPRPVQSSTGLE